jgi:cyanamide hydratase
MSSAIATHNFEAAPRDLAKLAKSIESGRKPQSHKTPSPLPDSAVAKEIYKQAEEELPRPTLHHSLRVFQYGVVIAEDFFPQWNLNKETFLLASLLHDIGTTSDNLSKTLMSFEFQGGLIAHAKTSSAGSPSEQSDAVAEAIIRHQDIDDSSKGEITRLGALLQLATLYDNAGKFSELIHEDTLNMTVEKYPRLKWSSCFSTAIENECERKPWSHTTKIGKDQFLSLIKGNPVGNSKE